MYVYMAIKISHHYFEFNVVLVFVSESCSLSAIKERKIPVYYIVFYCTMCITIFDPLSPYVM